LSCPYVPGFTIEDFFGVDVWVSVCFVDMIFEERRKGGARNVEKNFHELRRQSDPTPPPLKHPSQFVRLSDDPKDMHHRVTEGTEGRG